MRSKTAFRILFSSFLCLQTAWGLAQQVILPLQMNAALIQDAGEAEGQKSGGPEIIPVDLDSSKYILIDDFSYNSNWPNGNYWQDRSVYVNRNFPIKPPSVGVATFDGLDQKGYPYNFITATSYGPCDTLTSLPIQLSKVHKRKDDPVYLTFFYQAQGLNPNGNSFDDSLMLEFYRPYRYDTTIDFTVVPPDTTIDSTFMGDWSHVWGKTGYELQGDTACNIAFRKVTLKISPALYQDSFQFRFISWGNTSGNIDLWHLDFVILSSDANGHADLGDYAFIHPIGSLIDQYESMPWFHYVGNENQYKRDKRMVYKLRNTFTTNADLDFSYWTETPDGKSVDSIDLTRVVPIPARTCIETRWPDVSDPKHTFVFENSSIPDNSTTYFIRRTELRRVTGTLDLIEENNKIESFQVFGTYYAYDDGSAEAGYGVKSDQGKVALEFSLPEGVEDTLTSVYIHFNPVIEDRSQERFRITIWENDGGKPGDILYENSSTHTPEYPKQGVNFFTRIYLDQAVVLSDTFYLGYQKVTGNVMNIGYDMNKRKNNRLFYNLGTEWERSSAVQGFPQGALMIRPSFRNVDEVVVGQQEIAEIQEVKKLALFPNPARNVLNIRVNDENTTWQGQVFNLQGQVTASMRFVNSTHLDVSAMKEGLYILRIVSDAGEVVHEKFLVKH